MKRLIAALFLLPLPALAQDTSVAPSALARAMTANADQKFGSPCAYPDAALRARAVGDTVVAFRVEGDGQITDVRVVNSAGNSELDTAATECVAKWRADPSKPEQMALASTTISWSLSAPTDAATTEPPVGRRKIIAPAVCGTAWYPPAAIRAKAEGTAIFWVGVGDDGSITGVDIVQSTGNADLDAATVACVSKTWRFRPAIQNGKPVASRKQYMIRWQLQ